MSSRLWILGSPDPEMVAIESLLRECGETVAYAVDGRGERARGADAYRAHCEAARGYTGTVYTVECAVDVLDADVSGSVDCDCAVIRIDHHSPGDPGYGRPPAKFLAASSLGQVIAELARLGKLEEWEAVGGGDDGFSYLGEEDIDMAGLDSPAWVVGGYDDSCQACVSYVVPHDLVLTAAADHCLSAAYRGECPGVDPDELMRWRAESRAKFQGRSVDELLADIERARVVLEGSYSVLLEGCQYTPHPTDVAGIHARDMRGQHVPELPESGTRYGIAYIADGLPDRDGRKKVVCSGPTEVVRAFIEHWAPANGLVDMYGDPARGLAAGYINV